MTIKELEIQIITKLIALLQKQMGTPVSAGQPSTPAQLIYQKASESLGKHMTLDDTIPAEVGCAEAVSAVLALAGISDGPKGIPGTANLYVWLAQSPLFKAVEDFQPGDVIVNYTGSGNGSIEGHTGIVGAFGKEYPGDYGILSNESSSGLFHEQWSLARWKAYYQVTGGMPTHVFRAV